MEPTLASDKAAAAETIYFTVVTKSYLAHGRALAASVRALDPDAEFLLFLADEVDGCFDPRAEPFRCLLLDEYVPAEDKMNLTFGYQLVELCNALKAYAHRYVQDHTSASVWFYLDSDILLVERPQPFEGARPEHSLAITAHLTQLDPTRSSTLQEQRFLHHGVLNGGFVTLRRGVDAQRFIAWFVARMREACFYHPPFLFVDQLWLNLLAGAPYVRVWQHPGANLAYWNLRERTVEAGADGKYFVNGEPLLFVHLSGWDPRRPELVSTSDHDLPAPPCWQALAARYLDGLTRQGWRECRDWPYSFQRFSGGRPIRPWHRAAWWRLAAAEKRRLGDPFQAAAVLDRHPFYRQAKYRLRHRLLRWLRALSVEVP